MFIKKNWLRSRLDWLKKTASSFSDLTEAELRLAMLLRMDIRPREMTLMLGVSPDSLGKTRCRLRKKLGLDEEGNL